MVKKTNDQTLDTNQKISHYWKKASLLFHYRHIFWDTEKQLKYTTLLEDRYHYN